MKLFGLVILKKKDVLSRVFALMKENNMQEFKKTHKDTAQYWQGYEDGCHNICNWIQSKVK